MKPALKKVLLRAHWRMSRAIGATKLFAGVGSGRIRELWIGDSHTVLLNTGTFPLFMDLISERRFIWHLGPRLMHSVSAKGFPSVVRLHARNLGRLPRSRQFTVFFVFGEIDVRCHLAARLADGIDATWVETYVQRCVALANDIGAARIVILTPTPPSDEIEDHGMFPISGTIDERVAAHAWLSDALLAALPQNARVSAIDLRTALSGPDGRLPADLTYDGCHTNDAGRAAVRRVVLDHLESHPVPTKENTR